MLPTIRRITNDDYPLVGDVFSRLFNVEPALGSWTTTFQPPVDIVETSKEFKIVAECPGMTKENIQIAYENSVLTLSGEKEESKEESDQTTCRCERRYGKFVRSFTVPVEVDASKIAATFKDGVLEVVLPKSPQAQSQKIAIK